MTGLNVAYQLLALDPSKHGKCEKALDLLYQLRGYSKLWDAPAVSEAECRINDGQSTLSVVDVVEVNETSLNDDIGRAFILTLGGPFDEVEPRRELLAEFLKSLAFSPIYVLRDEVSEQIACKLYPHLYRIENLLRGYVNRFMATQVGPLWWSQTAPSEVADKAKMRRKNERVFGKYIDTSAYLIDFGELGELVYEHSSGFRTREEILERIASVPETPEAIRALKEELRTNYDKFFKESFADRNFKDKWVQFEVLRNKIAHCSLFTVEDLVSGEELAADIAEIISSADAEAAKLVITTEERDAIQEHVLSRSGPGESITQEVFLEQLDDQMRIFGQYADGFVGISRFINSILGPQGYSPTSSRAMLEQLKDAGVVEVYYVPNPNDPEFPTAAIRRTKVPAPSTEQTE